MIDFGHFALISCWLTSLYGFIGGVVGARRNNAALIRSAANAVYLTCLFAVLSFGSLAGAFINHDYHYLYVWQTSNNDMPWYYLISAVWGGMDGSMLLWATLTTVFAALVVRRYSVVPRDLSKWVTPVLSAASNFFLLVVVFLTNPFRVVPPNAMIDDGNGLNPLLQNPSMLIHPPMLYSGFTGFLVPAAFCLAALFSGTLGDQWIRLTRRWTLVAWAFLTCGIILGGNWAYIELGWGGFWAWDPVENASFLPWLTGTAFLHSVMVQERKGMLKVWNVSLSVMTYVLSVFGTFLTRSGVVQSVHAFAETDVGWIFLVYIGVVVLTTLVLVYKRWGELRPERRLESFLSREAAFLFNNLALLGICFATFWGVMFPVFSEWATGEKSVVGPPFFNAVNVPLFLILIFLMGVGPLIAWRRTSGRVLLKTFARPLLAGGALTILFLWLDPSRVSAAIAFGLVLFVMATIEAEIRRGVTVRRQLTSEGLGTGMVQLVKRKPRRYGGLLVHAGIGVMAVAITASMAYKIEKDITLAVGEKTKVGRYELELESLREQTAANYIALVSRVKVMNADSGAILGYLSPERRLYARNQETTTEVDIRMTPREDLYLALAGSDTRGLPQGSQFDPSKVPAMFKVFVNPLQIWLWIGGLIVLGGTITVLVPNVIESLAKDVTEREYGKVPAV
ncbi:MAG: heme lyase CcmF/NrfE family subunit [Bdellovibrionota bacterium]